ncbi:low-density lipoprotein receptor-related protein 2-like [Amphiura filiformis]|uniref:low-density lipoprotein receptor-related protein 2-like n=1 Tax=Amphiura filiformis TaxID=82378 RepID=UPI003B2235C6
MDSLYFLGILYVCYFTLRDVHAIDLMLVGELNVLSIGSHISMAPMNTLAFKSLNLGDMGDPHGIDFDPVDARIYWTDMKKGTITRSRLSGSNKEVLFNNALGAHGITIDKEDRVMYWSEEKRRSIWVANLDGTNRTRIISTGLKEPGDMQLDPVEKRLYWIDESGVHSKIESAKVDGSDRKTLIVNNLDRLWLKNPTGISLDIVERKIYWCDDKLDYIGRANMDGSEPENLFSKSSWFLPNLVYQPESIAVHGDYVYFVELMGFQVNRMPKDGSSRPKKVGKVEKVLFVPYGPLQGPVDIYIHTDFDYCSTSPCKQGGQCKGGKGWYRCNCIPGTGGPFCEKAEPLLHGGMEPNSQKEGGASVGGILGGLLIIALIIIIIAVVCYRRGRGDGRSEGDTVPIIFAAGRAEPPIPMETPPSKAKEAEAAGYTNDYEHPMETQLKGQDLGACGSDGDMPLGAIGGPNPPSYYEACKQTKNEAGYEPLII